MKLNLTNYDDKKILNITNVMVYMSPRSDIGLEITNDNFSIVKPSDSFLEVSFWICGVLIVCVLLYLITKQWCSGVVEEDDYKNVFQGEDNEGLSSNSSKKKGPKIMSGLDSELERGWGTPGFNEDESYQSDEYQGGVRY